MIVLTNSDAKEYRKKLNENAEYYRLCLDLLAMVETRNPHHFCIQHSCGDGIAAILYDRISVLITEAACARQKNTPDSNQSVSHID